MPPRTGPPVVSKEAPIAAVLSALDTQWLAERSCYLAGSTPVVARAGGYRPTRNITFLVANIDGWRPLREQLTSPEQLGAIALERLRLKQLQPLRAYRHSLHTAVEAEGTAIKFEIVLEVRIRLDPPSESDRVCGVLALTPRDLAATKLLANSDRWADDGVLSRDLIDLAMMQPTPRLLRAAVAKAAQAYGNSIEADLSKAIEALRSREGRLEHCMQGMRMDIPRALLLKRILALQLR